ncbi:uncharacterized protein BX663DRAFT_465750 [Cokeromyces recurvatus]|uniref:uncharacterized protein n=1 Tax=Cokeromyces recurvatus TaxID=90255 RepID=UPI0022205AC8|nr:uncharacterized protein BX663DRAFT_465750 [Cokeromyces recurvatus]KAI7907229.1 hypothetical protein BX663DRAFT_465750 [Cokeromyces recurvatus]
MSKRAIQNGGNKKKKQKIYHCSKENQNNGSNKNKLNITPEMKGVLVMCTRSKEARAVKEALDILSRYADKLYPADSEEVISDDDLEASIAKEVASLKQSSEKKKLANITTGIDCVAFIRVNPPIEPVKLVHTMLSDLKEKQEKTTRFISRYLPVEKVCHANLPDIELAAKSIFKPHFDQRDDEGKLISKKFAVVCRVRNCSKLDRMSVITTLASAVGAGHKVDLQEPELTIIAEICQTICMLSVVKDFNELKKYNIESILGINQSNSHEPKKENDKAEVEAEAD